MKRKVIIALLVIAPFVAVYALAALSPDLGDSSSRRAKRAREYLGQIPKVIEVNDGKATITDHPTCVIRDGAEFHFIDEMVIHSNGESTTWYLVVSDDCQGWINERDYDWIER